MTMEFFLLRNEEIHFSDSQSVTHEGLLKRVSYLPEAKIQATKTDDGFNNQNYYNRLRTALIENSCHVKYKDTEINWNFKLAIELPYASNEIVANPDTGDETVVAPPDGPGNLRIYVKKSQENMANFLMILHTTFNIHGGGCDNVTINVALKEFRVGHNLPSVNWKAKGLILKEVFNPNGTSVQCTFPLVPIPEKRVLTAWKSYEDFSGILTVSVVLNDSALSLLDSFNVVPKERFGHLRKMLENEICTDLEIHVGSPEEDQKVIKCHRAILAAGSEVFQRMFESGMKEATGNKIEIEEMSEEGVRAMLAYLYYREVKSVYGSSEIALELLQAGEKYDIQGLKDTVREYMLAKESEWFGVDVVLDLFIFVKQLCSEEEEIRDQETETEDDDDDSDSDSEGSWSWMLEEEKNNGKSWNLLKTKCLRVLKWYTKKKPITLMESVKYQEIFSRNLKLGMEISSGMLRLK